MKLLTTVALLALAAGCAASGATLRSGVGDRQLEHPPYYAGQRLTSASPVPTIVHFPIDYQRGASQSAVFDPASGPGTAVSTFLGEMNAFLDSVRGQRPVLIAAASNAVPPNVYFGCERDAAGDCAERGDSALGRRGTTMRLAAERPSEEWIRRTRAAIDSAGATHALLFTLEVGQYWPRQSGLLGQKRIELGTEYVENLPWLTSLETPVTVLQITGALVGRDGKAMRIGAEGLLAQRTAMVASALGLQRVVSVEDVNRTRSLRHSHRAGQPLVWQVAICQLLSELANSPCTLGGIT